MSNLRKIAGCVFWVAAAVAVGIVLLVGEKPSLVMGNVLLAATAIAIGSAAIYFREMQRDR